jgi:hydroxyquinol 1,2-dioxygenase
VPYGRAEIAPMIIANEAELNRAQGRHNLRPAHTHFMIHKAGYKTQFSQLYSADDPNLETDVQFGVTAALIGHYEAHDQASEPAPDAE